MALLLKNLLFTVIMPGTVGVYLPLWIAGGVQRSMSGWRLAAACLLLGAGVALYTACVWQFAHFGRGTPAPIDAPRRLVVRGPYRLVRNPMYVAVLAVILGEALLLAAPVLLGYAALVAGCFHLFITGYEEPHLRSVFGVDYEAYCRRVRRWLPAWPQPPAR